MSHNSGASRKIIDTYVRCATFYTICRGTENRLYNFVATHAANSILCNMTKNIRSCDFAQSIQNTP